jgi:GNAT superfamily N-acetyltransferase
MEECMEKYFTLKDGTEILIRPLTIDDSEASFRFFSNLPPEDRAYLRFDVTKKEIVEKRIREKEEMKIRRISVFLGDEIIADGALELGWQSWKSHIGELRLIVAHEFQRKGLGMLLAGELYQLAVRENLEEIVVKIMKPQIGALKIVRKLGFHEDVILKKLCG